MRARTWLLLLLALGAGQVGCARNPALRQQVESQLRGPFLLLRGAYGGDRLNYDAQGNLQGSAETIPFSLSAVRLDKVKVTGSAIELQVTREGLLFSGSGPDSAPGVRSTAKGPVVSNPLSQSAPQQVSAEPWKLDDRAKISIALDPQHPDDISAALARVFSVGITPSMADAAPPYWQRWIRHDLDPKVELEPRAKGPGKTCGAGRKLCQGVKAPVLLHTVEPKFSLVARRRRYQGICVVGMVIDPSGTPTKLRIVRPLGMGLDEQAVDAVSRYRFQPAMKDGQPVAVFVNIEVNFHIY